MIYCVIAKDRETGNEWVMPKTAETIVDIGSIIDDYRESDNRFEYRLELVNPGMEVQRPSLPSYVIRAFTVAELFPLKKNLPSTNCTECGAYVTMPHQTVHTTWHNKVADL